MKFVKIKILLAIVLMLTALPGLAASRSHQAARAERRLQKAAHDLNQLVNARDSGIPQTILADANCVAIVPKFIKGGFVFGGQYGRGVATCRDNQKRWSAPAFFTLVGGSWGAQIGVSN